MTISAWRSTARDGLESKWSFAGLRDPHVRRTDPVRGRRAERPYRAAVVRRYGAAALSRIPHAVRVLAAFALLFIVVTICAFMFALATGSAVLIVK